MLVIVLWIVNVFIVCGDNCNNYCNVWGFFFVEEVSDGGLGDVFCVGSFCVIRVRCWFVFVFNFLLFWSRFVVFVIIWKLWGVLLVLRKFLVLREFDFWGSLWIVFVFYLFFFVLFGCSVVVVVGDWYLVFDEVVVIWMLCGFEVVVCFFLVLGGYEFW